MLLGPAELVPLGEKAEEFKIDGNMQLVQQERYSGTNCEPLQRTLQFEREDHLF